MNFWKSAEGVVKVTLTGADPGASLNVINQTGIRLYDVAQVDELTVSFRCSRRDYRAIGELCAKRGDRLVLQERLGLFYLGKTAARRHLLVSGILFFYLLTWLLPTRVLFIRVEGNVNLPARQILAAASDCGIRFGASRRAVRSEKMKNTLLEAMPELKWAGINTAGCTAVISVRERDMPESLTVTSGIRSIVAARDGFITSCTVTRGNGLCTPGQVVQKGQTLISGYTDCGISIQVTGAEGEVYAETCREMEAVMPLKYRIRQNKTGSVRRYSVILGKNRINFAKGSGISPVTCDRMYQEYPVTLPGGFCLPICLGVETVTQWETAETAYLPQTAEYGLSTFARRYVLAQSVAGKILTEQLSVTRNADHFRLQGRFLCSEMIGRVITEEIGVIHGKNS